MGQSDFWWLGDGKRVHLRRKILSAALCDGGVIVGTLLLEIAGPTALKHDRWCFIVYIRSYKVASLRRFENKK